MISLLSSPSTTMKKFKRFSLPTSKPSAKGIQPNFFFLFYSFLFCWRQQRQACYISAMIYSLTSWLLTTYGSFVWVCLLGCLITWSACFPRGAHFIPAAAGIHGWCYVYISHQADVSNTLAWPCCKIYGRTSCYCSSLVHLRELNQPEYFLE